MNKIKWLLVGPGDIANSRVAPALMEAEHSELVAICGRFGSLKTQKLAEKTGVSQVYDDLDKALAESGADAVYIATPHHLHVEMCKKALMADKHVFCEKPLGIHAEECKTLLECVRARPHLATGCSNYRLFTNQFRTLQKLILEGAIGDLIGGWAQDEENYYNPSNAPLLKEYGMSPIHGFGFYLIDLARAVFGIPVKVMAHFSRFNEKRENYDIDDYENILMEYEGGKQFSILLNMAANAPIRHSYEFHGTKGRILMPECPPHFNKPIELFYNNWQHVVVEESVTGDGGRVNWHLAMVQDFIDSILENRKPACTIENAVKTAIITDAIIRSAESGLPVFLD